MPKVSTQVYMLDRKIWKLFRPRGNGRKRTKCDQFFCSTSDFFDFCNPCFFYHTLTVGIVIYLHTEGALYAQKSVPSWFLAVFDSKIDVCVEIWKKLSILWYTKFQLVTVKYYEVEALFCKMSRHMEKLGSVPTKYQYQVTVLGTGPVLEIGTILRHLNGCNFLIPRSNSTSDRTLLSQFRGTDQLLHLGCHERAKLLINISALWKCWKLLKWYHNDLCYLKNITWHVLWCKT